MTFLLISFVAGILTVLAPCVLPLLPAIVGGSMLGGRLELKKAFVVTLSLGLSILFFTMLLKAGTLFVDVPLGAWKAVAGAILVGFGIVSVFPEAWEGLPFPFIGKASNAALAKGYRENGLIGHVAIGAALGPVFSSCSPTYFVVLATVLPQDFATGMLYLVAYVVGLCLTLLLVSYAGQNALRKIGAATDPRGIFRRSLGALFILVGLTVMTGYDKKFEAFLLEQGVYDVTRIERAILELVR